MPEKPPRRVWLFDLDNTLHDANPHIFPHINRAMRDYIARHLGVNETEATRLRQHYWDRYGATLLGLMRHHAVDPVHFLSETHRFGDLPGLLCFSPTVRAAIRRLPGQKFIFSNAPRQYTLAILRLTGLMPHFDGVYAVEDTAYQPKPLPGGFLRLLSLEGLQPRQCIMVEDSLINLQRAKRLGMTTVWVSAGLRNSPSVDLKIRSVAELPQRFARL